MAEKRHKDREEEAGSLSDFSRHDTDDNDDEGELDDYDFGYVGDEFEDFDGDFTKQLNSALHGGYRPNRQLGAGESLRYQQLRSGEAYIQEHLDSNTSLDEKYISKDRDRADRATVEQVLDPRTRLILFKLIQREVFEKLEGCVSTGKEANVYHGVLKGGGSLAVKIYKTSILTFKDRDRYVTGEFRYRRGYCRHNPRKMVATWAEKEMRNLQRMHQAGLSVPKPVTLKSHILVMEFIGVDGWPAPLAKNAEMDEKLAEKLYLDCVWMMRRLYRQCRLVHADLSEYNLMVFEEKLFVFDVSQSVEHDHPHSLEFLRSDVSNVTRFFRDRGVEVLPMRELFEVIVDPLIETDAQVEEILGSRRSAEQLPDDALFMKAYIPHKLEDMEHYERDDEVEKTGAEPNNPFQKVIGKTMEELTAALQRQGIGDDSEGESGGSCGETASSDEGDDEGMEGAARDSKVERRTRYQRYPRVRGESPDVRRDRKETVKLDKREKRMTKVPKKVKKRRETLKRRNR